jgi:cytosine/adenosine deaminase-related metal-dependent hydrolase
MKGMLPSLPLEVFMLFESPALPELLPTPREAYVRTLLAAAEMLRSGTTSVQDDAFFVPHPTPEITDAVMQAYADIGIRARVALDQPMVAEIHKLPYLADMLPAGMRVELSREPEFGAKELVAANERHIAAWHGREGGRIKAAVSISAPQRVTPAYFEAIDGFSRQYDLPLYAHMLETRTQRVFGDECLGGRSLVRYTADLGLLSERTNLIHGIWIDEADIRLIADAGTVVAHNPVSNLRLGSGIMPFRALRDHGIRICLGSDEAIADDSVNLWSVIKAAGLVHNLTQQDWELWPTAHEVLDCMWNGGARAMHEAGRIGAIAAGYQADLAILDLDTFAFTPRNDMAGQLVYCENGSSVRLTMVAGNVVFENGKLTNIDERALRKEAREIFATKRDALAHAGREAARWLPFYRQMILKAMNAPMNMERRVPQF